MKMTKILTGFSAACVAVFLAVQPVQASEEGGGTPHFPINHPKHVHWSFAGIFGKWDHQQLQRGLQVYKEVCSACHSMKRVAFRNLQELGYTDEEVRAFAKEYTVTDGPDAEGEMYERAAVPSDRFPSPFPNEEAAAASNNGAAPPDFSLLAKARAPERGFPTFLIDLFWGANGGFGPYAENGPDYIYSLLTGYQDAPAGVEVPEGGHYNPYFNGAATLAMAPPLSDEIVEYEDGSPMTVDQYARDVAAFMMWAAEPSLVQRKSMGFKVILFLLLLSALMYLTKKAIFANLKSGGAAATAAPAAVAASAAAPMPAAPAASMPASAVSAVPEASAAPKAGIDFIDDIELIDGIGATIAKRLRTEGVKSLTQIASMASGELGALAEKVNAKGRPEREEWQEQARELIAGLPPRAQVDRLKVEKMLNKKF